MLTHAIKRSTLFAVLILGILFGVGINQAVAVEITPPPGPLLLTGEGVKTSTPSPSPLLLTGEMDEVPMSDAAAAGLGCLILIPPTLAAAYAYGPTEIMMLVTGAVIIPSSSAQLFISLGGILGAASCGAGAMLTPSVLWALQDDGSDNLTATPPSDQNNLKSVALVDPPQTATVSNEPEELSEDIIQGNGCLAGILTLGGITLATAPIEIVGLAAGGVTVPSSSATLMLGIVGTIIPAGCTIGAAASLPLVALSRYMGLNNLGQGIASMFGWGTSTPQADGNTLYIEALQPTLKSADSLLKTGNKESSTNLVLGSKG